jgi:hypothetical protein
VTTALHRRLNRVEAAARADVSRRWNAATDTRRRSLTPEHTAIIRAWFDLATPTDAARCPSGLAHRAPRFCDRCINKVRPPALLRALHTIVVSHITTGSPVAMPPEVARVYVDDPDAVPSRPCGGCGYLLPMRAKIRPDGSYRYLGSYEGACPVCERDTRDDIDQEGPG